MTARKPESDWTEERLEAAFAARAAAAPTTPPQLGDDVLVHLPPRGSSGERWRWVSLIAAAIAVAVVVGIGGLPDAKPAQPGLAAPSAAASDSTSASDGPATPTPASAVLAALGDPLTVSEALAVRVSGDRYREIRVRGYLSHAPVIYCPLVVGPGNPTIITCPANWQWLMEQLETIGSNGPAGPAIHASFALVEPPLPLGQTSDPPVQVELIGHFNDRRASLCDAMNACEETFVVDRTLEVGGNPMPVRTINHTGRDLKDIDEDLDALVAGAAPGAVVLSRQVVEIKPSFAIEPVLADDPVLSAWDPAGPLWLVIAVDLRPAGAIARTFALIDGSDWFAEVTANGAKYLDRTAVTPSDGPQPQLPTGDPSAFDAAPTSMLGIPVRNIATLEAMRATSMDQLGRAEQAVRAWYLGPPPGISCTSIVPAIHPPTPPCDEARHWLLDDPHQYGVEQGQLRLNPAADHLPPVLNPLFAIDVAFDVGETWHDGVPVPRPVIVLGHFADHRVDTYAGNLYFVIDALAWTPNRPAGSLDSVVRLTSSATEDVAAVLGRIAEVAPKEAVATWVTVVDASDFAELDRRSMEMPEFTSGVPVWLVARLAPDERDGRLAVEWAWTADHGQRVWRTECADCSPDLATTLDVDVDGTLVRVFDYDQVITSAGTSDGLSGLDWHQPHGNATDSMDVARGRTDREVVLRWRTNDCGATWSLTVGRFTEGRVYFSPSISEECNGDPVVLGIVLEFKDAVDIDKIDGPSCCG
jgi:hypothetical protein